jgi:hypothetical protein
MKKSLPIKRAVFWLDGGERVPGWSTGKTWNGWSVPLFDESQIEAARAALRVAGIESDLHSGDILEFWPVEEPDLITEHQAIRLKGKTYYWQLDGLTWNEESSGGRRADEASADVWGHAPLPESMLKDVARDLRRLNNMTFSVAFREGTRLRVYLQLADDGTWGIGDREPTSGRWGSAAIPGNNRRFNATAVARDLLAQVERAAIGLDVGNASRTAPRHLRAEEHRVRESRFEIPGWSVGYHSEISAHAAVRTGRGRDWLFVMTTPEDREPRSLDEEVTVGLYFFNGDDWEQIAYVDFPDVRSVIKLGDAELHLVIEHGLSLDQSRELLVQEFDDWDGEDTLTSWMQTILKDAGVEPEEAGADAATHEATEQIYNASPAQILEYMDERSKAMNE